MVASGEKPITSSRKLPRLRPSKINPDMIPKRGPSLHRYFRRITVGGIDNYLLARGKLEKVFWLLVILLGIAGTVVYLVPTFTSYLQYTTVLDIGYQTRPDLKLPNTWICLWAVNYTYFYDRFSQVQPQLRRNKRLQLFAKRLTAIWKKVFNEQAELSVDTILNFTLNYVTAAPFAEGLDVFRYAQPQLLNEVLYRVIEAAGIDWTGIRTFYEEGFFDCPSVLKKCTLNGVPIDCCRDSVSGYNAQERKCYKIDVSSELLNNPSLVVRDQPIELSIETFADSQFYPWYVDEPPGIEISFQTHLPTMFDDPHYLAAGTSNKLNVRGIRKRKLFDCIDRYRYNAKLHVDADPLMQEYFKDMESPAIYSMAYCATGRLLEAMSVRCGCVPYFDALRPNDSNICTPAHIYACYYGSFQDTPEMEAIVKDAGVQQKDIFVDLKGLMASECEQLCDSWFYDSDVFSTIMDGEEGGISTYWRNKVTVVFDPEYRVETEMLKMDFHTFVASIGYSLGLMLGISFITLIQLAFWLAASLCFLRRLGRVEPNVAEVEFDQIPQAASDESQAESHAIRINQTVSIPIIRIGDDESL